MMPTWACDVVKVTQPGWREERGSRVRDWTNGVERTYGGCSFQHSTATADNSTGPDASNQATLYMPYSAIVANGDRVEFRGERWHVAGNPMKWTDPFGVPSHQVVSLRRQGAGNGD